MFIKALIYSDYGRCIPVGAWSLWDLSYITFFLKSALSVEIHSKGRDDKRTSS